MPNKKFSLIELARRLSAAIDLSHEESLKKEAADALHTAISANIQILLDKNGPEIPANCTLDQLRDKVVEQHAENLQYLTNTLHDLILFQANSETFQAVVKHISSLGGGG
jgi:hypothetical protein